MRKVILVVCFLLFICGCSVKHDDYNNEDSLKKTNEVDSVKEREKNATNEIYIPKSFSMKQIMIKEHIVSAASNGRYYIFKAVKGMDPFIEGEMYLYESYDGLAIRFNPELMCGDDPMNDINVHGDYCPGEKDFKIAHTRVALEKIPIGFDMFIIYDGDFKTHAWSDGRYRIFKAIYNEYEDWYIQDSEDGWYIRYEPSFMTGKEQ